MCSRHTRDYIIKENSVSVSLCVSISLCLYLSLSLCFPLLLPLLPLPLSLSHYQMIIAPQLVVGLHLHLLSSIQGYVLAGALPGLMYAAKSTVSLYMHHLCCVCKTISLKLFTTLALNNLSAPSSAKIPEPCGERYHINTRFRTVNSTIFYLLHIDQL